MCLLKKKKKKNSSEDNHQQDSYLKYISKYCNAQNYSHLRNVNENLNLPRKKVIGWDAAEAVRKF